jgi:hypothetical protein
MLTWLRDRWTVWQVQRSCRRTIGHCWHPTGYVDWRCCECGKDTDGMPAHRCTLCNGLTHDVRAGKAGPHA